MSGDVPRPEHPRPRLRRERWASLNGTWSFAFDDDDAGRASGWHRPDARALDREIVVPFAYQAEASGIGTRDRHDVVWYARRFDDLRHDRSERLLLHVGAADYRADVWVNGEHVAAHEGGHTPFSADVTDVTAERDNRLVIRVEDPLDDLTIPRGKQYWKARSEGIFYTPTTGIWQTVWLEPVPAARVDDLRVRSDLAAGAFDVEVDVTEAAEGCALRLVVELDGTTLADDHVRITGSRMRRRVPVDRPTSVSGAAVTEWGGLAVWSPETPVLHDLRVEVRAPDGRVIDQVASYAGLREVTVEGGQVLLNGRPRYQRLVLDQGYFPGGLMTAPTDADLRQDIELAKALGFDGARKHQKVEDPRWLHWADRLGFLVWEEMPSAYEFTADAARRVSAEWADVVRRDLSHPCVVAWVPMNESWGVPAIGGDARQRAHLDALYHLTHALDGTRPVVSNDGWEHGRTDLYTIHDYGDAATLRDRYRAVDSAVAARPAGRPLSAPGHAWSGQPVVLSEFGGIALDEGGDAWGYHTAADADALLGRYRDLVEAVSAGDLQGFCYTQLTDLEQEANGLLRFDRKPKIDLAEVRRVTTGSRR